MNYYFSYGLYVLHNVSITVTYPVSNFFMRVWVTSIHEVLLYMYLTGLDVYLEFHFSLLFFNNMLLINHQDKFCCLVELDII